MNTECAKCKQTVCYSEHFLEGPENCPTKVKNDVIKRAWEEYEKPEVNEFARQASVQEFECYMNLPEGRTPRLPRVEEIVQFSRKMKYHRLGVASCLGLKSEAEILNRILENRGFEVVSVCCKVGAIPKEQLGLRKDQKIAGPDVYESMCNPISQAMILNDAGVDFNILLGLCVGHDSLFIKYAKAPITVLVAKDRVLGHNPVAGLYLANSYYRKLLRKEGNSS